MAIIVKTPVFTIAAIAPAVSKINAVLATFKGKHKVQLL